MRELLVRRLLIQILLRLRIEAGRVTMMPVHNNCGTCGKRPLDNEPHAHCRECMAAVCAACMEPDSFDEERNSCLCLNCAAERVAKT